jgi:hypothetical protein
MRKITLSGEPQGFCVKTHSTKHSPGTAILFCQHPGLVVRLPQPLSAGVAAQTLLTYLFALLTQHATPYPAVHCPFTG